MYGSRDSWRQGSGSWPGWLLRPAFFVSSTTSWVRFRSVISRVICENPHKSPPSSQNRGQQHVGPEAHAMRGARASPIPRSVRAPRQFPAPRTGARARRSSSADRTEKVLADDFVRRDAVNALGSQIPAHHFSFRVEHEERVVAQPFHHQPEPFFGSISSLVWIRTRAPAPG